MTKPAFIAVLTAAVLLLGCHQAYAQRRVERAGIINSPKEFGIALGIQQSDRQVYNTLHLTADMEGILDATETQPGIKFTWLHQNQIREGIIREDVNYKLYFGGGFTTGYVRDNGAPGRNMGPILGLASGVGVLFLFQNNIDIGITFTGEFGFQLREDETFGTLDLSWYANGVYKALIPQITLYYRFK
ncbi:MAG: hypothetical protein IKS71_01870 [Bacteroidales bacterium]|nr:hypothetical protein [Bacteroidales bacterium]